MNIGEEWQIMDISGRVVLNGKSPAAGDGFKINTEELTSGLYFFSGAGKPNTGNVISIIRNHE
jgi:hypothetical protein